MHHLQFMLALRQASCLAQKDTARSVRLFRWRHGLGGLVQVAGSVSEVPEARRVPAGPDGPAHLVAPVVLVVREALVVQEVAQEPERWISVYLQARAEFFHCFATKNK